MRENCAALISIAREYQTCALVLTGPRPMSPATVSPSSKGSSRWLTRNVFAIGMLSLFSDAGHELTTAILPLFLATFSGSAAALGIIEGFSDAGSSVLKLWM